jgi:hypothetical protein
MKMALALVGAALLAAVGAGCAGSRNTNLTPRTLPATPESSYLFETTFDSRRRGVDPASAKAWVMLGQELYPMQRVPNTENRFEALVPLPPGQTYWPYKYKFEYEYPSTLSRERNSTWSQEYRLVVPHP